MKLNIGCGKKILEGYVNLDKIKLPGVDVVQDLNKYPWEFQDNTFDEIYADNVMEHLE
jgi:predicted SAM-dependent methyltransferase